MTKAPLAPGYAASMRQMAKTFEQAHTAQIGRDQMLFSRPLLHRQQNPMTSRSGQILRLAIESSDPQKGDMPGLTIERYALNDHTQKQALLRTPKMIEADCGFIVYADLSVLFVENVDANSGTIQVMPTPLKLRGTVQSRASGKKSRIKGRRKSQSRLMSLFIDDQEVCDDDWMAGMDPRYAPPANGEVADYITQLDVEARALSRRMAAMARYDTPAPANLCPGSNNFYPDFGNLPSWAMNKARAAFLGRAVVSDDDAWLGHLSFDPSDPVIAELRKLLALSLRLIHSEFGYGPDHHQLHATLSAPDPWSDIPRIETSFSMKVPLEKGGLTALVAERMGQSALKVAAKYFAVPLSSGWNERIQLAVFNGPYDIPSAHERLSRVADHIALRAEFDALAHDLETDP